MKDLLNNTLKALARKEKIDKFYVKIKINKDNKKVKRQAINWEKIFETCVTSKV